MEERVAALERECAELRRQLAATQSPPTSDAASFLESLLAAVPAFIIRTDANMRMLYINHVPMERLSEVLGREVWDFLTPASIEVARTCIERVLATGVPGTYEATSIAPDGTASYFETFVTPLADPNGGLGVCLVAVDVTRLHVRDLALRRSEEELRVAVEATGIALWRWSPVTNEVHWYPRTYEVYGRSAPVDLMDYVDVLVHPDDREMVRANTAGSIAGGPFSGPIHRIIREDGGVRWILSRGYTELDANGHPVRMIGGSLDVTQQHELEEQLRHAQRLDAVGHLTAGVAHNFNNMLTVVTGTLELLARGVPEDKRRLVEAAREASLRSAEMVRQLMTFTGQRAQPDRRVQDIGRVVEQVVEMCRQTFDRHIIVSCTIAPKLPLVRCTSNEIEQVLMNLLVNARDAVIEGGRATSTIAVTVDAIPDPRGTPTIYTRLTVRDDGIGMTEDVVQRAFDPFFTTKEVGRGTGLGLTTSFAIVRELEGTITCESTRGSGTSFVVCIPSGDRTHPARAIEVAPVSQRGRVLLVDDDELVRRVVTSLLIAEAFEVVGVASGDAALAHLSTHPAPDAIILDRSMPGAPGETFVSRIRTIAPGAPIMMFTGQAVGPAVAALVDAVILKPITGADLIVALETLIGKPGPSHATDQTSPRRSISTPSD
jgi:two-component system cell cycle sensor histidine kinase/response regulator CckA